MKEKKNSPRKLKQSKISSLWFSQATGSRENTTSQVNERKRKIEEDVCEVEKPLKKISLDVTSGKSEIFVIKSEKHYASEKQNEKENQIECDFEDFPFEDFENNPFLSPKKERSPKKGVLTENSSQPSSEEDNWESEFSALTFETAVKCKVLKFAVVTAGHFEQILLLQDEKSGNKGVCTLRGVWTCSSISVNDIVVVQTTRSRDGWVVDNETGYIVLHPNIIISSTALVGSMFCMRRGLFSNFYKGIESGSKSKMVIGKLVHELLQKCLKARTCTDNDLAAIISTFFESTDYLHEFYFSGMDYAEIDRELRSFAPRIRNFLDVYVNGVIKPSEKNFEGSIEDILDIEELVRSPSMGFQGRIDATVKIKSGKSEKIAPLELKTGRSSFSNEHKSQLILYILLLKEIGKKVSSGLLLYLKDGLMEEVIPSRVEIRDLFLLRNRLVGYYKSLKTNELPEPIRLSSYCQKCPYLRICTTYLKCEELYETHSIRSVEIPDIKPSHVDYFFKWNKLLWLEYGNGLDEEADEFEIDNLKLNSNVEKFGSDFKYNFTFTGTKASKKLQLGTFVHLYNSKSNRICTGKVISFSNSSCSLCTDQELNNFLETYKLVVFKFKFLNIYLSNLGLFLNESYKSLREIIIDRRTPSFEEKLDKKSFKEKCLKEMLLLNKEQQKAVLKSLLCNDYLLIKGPPGTGKTQTIAALVKIFLGLGKRVLLVGHTNSSVDNVLLRLDGVEYLRLGSLKSIVKKIHDRCYANLIKTCSTVSDVEKLFKRNVIASTCAGIETDFIEKIKFDVCVVDESSQVLQTEILRPLFCCKKFILVGDEDQLPPIVQNLEAKKLGMDLSMFEWLANESATVKLKFQYRMNLRINSLANSIAYNGLIECANEEVATAMLKIVNQERYLQSDCWIKQVLSPSMENSVIFVDTSDYFRCKGIETPESPRSSTLEANLIQKLALSLTEFGLKEEALGVIAPFGDQIALLKKKLLDKNLEKIELNTVDQYQGRDKDVIIFSCGKENQAKIEVSESELLNDLRRLTVAVTRAKHKLILVGDKQTVLKYKPFQKLFAGLKESEYFYLKNDQDDFYWAHYEDPAI